MGMSSNEVESRLEADLRPHEGKPHGYHFTQCLHVPLVRLGERRGYLLPATGKERQLRQSGGDLLCAAILRGSRTLSSFCLFLFLSSLKALAQSILQFCKR